MNTDDTERDRIKYYGLNDYATFHQVDEALQLVGRDLPSHELALSEVLELHNAALFVENGLLPTSYSDAQRSDCRERASRIRVTVAKYFNALEDDALPVQSGQDLYWRYHEDLLQLLVKYKVHERCSPESLFGLFDRSGIALETVLTQKPLVHRLGETLRQRLLNDPVSGEILVRTYLDGAPRRGLYLPDELTTGDKHALLNAYIDSGSANPNFVELIAFARPLQQQGIDAPLKLKARRWHERWTKEFFEQNEGIKTGCEVAIKDQLEPVDSSLDGFEAKYTYSRQWLEGGLDHPTILNNFIYLFEFTDHHMILTLPSYEAERGVFERFLQVSGRDSYPAGPAFRHKESASFLQTVAYEQFLAANGVRLESTLAWFFNEYLTSEFNAPSFAFSPPSQASTYLEKCRHMFAEIESTIKKFSLYVQEGEIDSELLTLMTEQVRYRAVPSLVPGKYVRPTNSDEIQNTLHLLFSDQSSLTYIGEDLKAENAARLIIKNEIPYERFHAYQKDRLDYLERLNVLSTAGSRVRFVSAAQIFALRTLFSCGAASYYHFPEEARRAIDEMVGKGWLAHYSHLLTDAEADLYNYYLSQAVFSNGPDLRNKYLHGTQPIGADENEHYAAYITATKLLVGLVIKMNDDFALHRDATPGMSNTNDSASA